ncbi:hypothetical protein LCGC14_1808810, partial [marine sediment metagenome]
GTDYIDIVIGGMTGLFAVWNVADDTPVFYVNERGDTDIAGDLTVGTLILTDGSITDSSGTIDFGNEVLSTSGKIISTGLEHTGDPDTYFVFGTDQFALYCGGAFMIQALESFINDKVEINPNEADIDFIVNGDTVADLFKIDAGTDSVRMKGGLKILEQAAADGDVAAYGQLWVKNTTPCELWFTDDAGLDTQIV